MGYKTKLVLFSLLSIGGTVAIVVTTLILTGVINLNPLEDVPLKFSSVEPLAAQSLNEFDQNFVYEGENFTRQSDVIIIGAGASGLAAASALANSTLKVLVLEANVRPICSDCNRT